MVMVRKMPGDSDEALIRKFSRKVLLDGVLLEVKRRQFHAKKSMAKKLKEEEKLKMRKFNRAA